MINIKKEYQIELLKYFTKSNYDTNKILEENEYLTIHQETKDFLENLSFEKNGFLSNETLCSEHKNNSERFERKRTRKNSFTIFLLKERKRERERERKKRNFC